MATLRSPSGDTRVPLAPRVVAGRSEHSDLRLEGRFASSAHATIWWTGDHWQIRDLGSRNGTFVDGVRLESGASAPIRAGARIAFGDPKQTWALTDDVPPPVMAIHVTDRTTAWGTGDMLVLPNDEQPEACVFGDDRGWWLDSGDGKNQPIGNEAVVSTSAGSWRIRLPTVSDGTPLLRPQPLFERAELQFQVSRDEEVVRLSVSIEANTIALAPREHMYVLLTLARARLQDAKLSTSTRGWRDVDDLERMLLLERRKLNVAIHRARQQLSAAGIAGAAKIVEVRRSLRRLGTDRFTIQRIDSA